MLAAVHLTWENDLDVAPPRARDGGPYDRMSPLCAAWTGSGQLGLLCVGGQSGRGIGPYDGISPLLCATWSLGTGQQGLLCVGEGRRAPCDGRKVMRTTKAIALSARHDSHVMYK